ncbi:hypothetical protein PILCRDRAFT_16387 [Piloderma croceum F 1598]|uniref:Uncharacterized protein n=1 Tax=Piloderma croceum (strain F 1598) TaxID=765440 RepID=A0A0C3AEI1_PILCF|nr:hypothetical protein PILCRDRAFT_16387 [Piloderma croceum F 1598]
MSYYYEDPGYADYGNHGDEYDKYDKYDKYSDHAEPDYCEYEDANTYYYGDADHEDVPGGSEQEHEYHDDGMRGAENGAEVETNELRELEHEGDEGRTRELKYRTNEEEYEHEVLAYEGDKHGELAYEPTRDAETRYATYKPHRFEQNEGTDEHTHPHLYHLPIPTYVPLTPSFSPPHTPYARDAPRSNQRGHVTASKHAYVSDDNVPRRFECDGVFEHEGPAYHNARTTNGTFPRPQLVYHEESGEYVHPCFLAPAQIPHHHNNPNSPPPSSIQNQPAPSPRNYSDINVLLQDIRDGDSEAIAYMAELNRYTEECGRIEMEKQVNGDHEYGEGNSGMEPQHNQETKDPENGATPTEPPLVNTPTSPPPPSTTTLDNNTPAPTTPYFTS